MKDEHVHSYRSWLFKTAKHHKHDRLTAAIWGTGVFFLKLVSEITIPYKSFSVAVLQIICPKCSAPHSCIVGLTSRTQPSISSFPSLGSYKVQLVHGGGIIICRYLHLVAQIHPSPNLDLSEFPWPEETVDLHSQFPSKFRILALVLHTSTLPILHC